MLKEGNKLNISMMIGSNSARSICFAFLVGLSIGLWIFHYLIPQGAPTYNLGFFTIGSHGYNDVQIFVWVISRKLMVIVPMVLWFWSYPSWWRYSILSPLILYLYQIWEVLQDGYKTVDAFGNYKVFPLVFLTIVLLLVLSRIVRRYSRSLDIYDQISRQIESHINTLGKERSGVGDYRRRYEQILGKLVNKDSTDKDLVELASLQRELQRKIIS